jgi:hypothetical protein
MERSVETRNSPSSSSFDDIEAVLDEVQEALTSSRSCSDTSPFSFEGSDDSSGVEAEDSTATPPSPSPPGTPGSHLATMAPTIP